MKVEQVNWPQVWLAFVGCGLGGFILGTLFGMVCSR